MDEILDMLKEIRPEFDFEASDNYIDDELLDSFDIVTLVSMFEKKYGITIDALDIIPDYFTTATDMLMLISKYGGKG